ncbi:MAG: tetratricopeptide repeat protein [Siphonobacter sp.]
MKYLAFLFLFPLLTQAADFEWSPRVQQAYGEIIRLRLNRGRQLLASEGDKNGVALFLLDYADVLQLLLTENRNSYDSVLKQNEARLNALENMDEDSPWNRCLRAEIKLHSAFVKIKFGKEVAGLWDIIKAYKLLAENAEEFPNFTYNQKALGLLHVLIGSTPENYRWATRLIGLRGNIQQGLGELRNVAAREVLFRDETNLLSYLIQGYVLRMDSKELADFENFVEQHEDNLLIQFFGNALLMKEGHGEAALSITVNHPATPEYLSIPFFEYHRGEILLQKGQYMASLGAYQTFLKKHTAGNFIKDAYYRQYLCHELMGDNARAKALYDQVKSVGEANNEADKTALKICNAAYKPMTLAQKLMMKVRLAGDGGYYERAITTLKQLSEASFTEPMDRAEFNYRKARIYHRIGDLTQAIPFYERSVQLSEGQAWHFGASSCLQLGYIYQARNDKPKARTYFNKALSYKKHEFKNSVEGKAKAALNEMGY